MRRALEVAWVVDHMEDLASDFSVFYRVDDMLELPSARFFAFAYRVSAYDGVMRLRVQELEQQKSKRPGARNQTTRNKAVSISQTKRKPQPTEEPKEVSPRVLAGLAHKEIEYHRISK